MYHAFRAASVLPTRLAPSVVGGIGLTVRLDHRKVYTEFFNDGSVVTLFSDGQGSRTKRIDATESGYRELVDELDKYLSGSGRPDAR